MLISNLAGTLDGVALQVQTHSTNTGREVHHLLGCGKVSVRGAVPEWVTTEHTLHVPETPDTADTITDAYKTRLGQLYAGYGTERRTQNASHLLNVSTDRGARNAGLDSLSLYADAMAWRRDAVPRYLHHVGPGGENDLRAVALVDRWCDGRHGVDQGGDIQM